METYSMLCLSILFHSWDYTQYNCLNPALSLIDSKFLKDTSKLYPSVYALYIVYIQGKDPTMFELFKIGNMILIPDGEQELRNEKIVLWQRRLREILIDIVHLDFSKAIDRASHDIFTWARL